MYFFARENPVNFYFEFTPAALFSSYFYRQGMNKHKLALKIH